MQTYENVLHVYSMHTSKETVVSIGSSLSSVGDNVEYRRVDIYMQQNQRLSSGTATANDFAAQARRCSVTSPIEGPLSSSGSISAS